MVQICKVCGQNITDSEPIQPFSRIDIHKSCYEDYIAEHYINTTREEQ